MSKNNHSHPSRDLLSNIIDEAASYTTLEKIESLVENMDDLSNLPVEPLYRALKSMPTDKVAEVMHKFSQEQKAAFWDLDLWVKDDLDIEHFEFWTQVYGLIKDEDLVLEFMKASSTLLYLKGRYNIWTFDLEDPMYPDHDNYFLTDDQLLLFEYDATCSDVDEVQAMIRIIYSILGVEEAYAHLFKMVADSFLEFKEEEFNFKKGRLADFGFVDYYDALAFIATFSNTSLINKFINNKIISTPTTSSVGQMQSVNPSGVMAFAQKKSDLHDELLKIEDEKRSQFLSFNFIRLINGSFTINNSFKASQLEMAKLSKMTLQYLELGLDYIKNVLNIATTDTALFELFDFTEIYKVGLSLIKIEQKKIKNIYESSLGIADDNVFLGAILNDFYENSFDDLVSFKSFGLPTASLGGKLVTLSLYQKWQETSVTFLNLMPFIDKFYSLWESLKQEGKVDDSYYCNYSLADIDFEAIILSSLINFADVDKNKDNNSQKLAITRGQFILFMQQYFDDEGNLLDIKKLEDIINQFIIAYGMQNINQIKSFLMTVVLSHLEGYEVATITDEEFKHIGGPIILA